MLDQTQTPLLDALKVCADRHHAPFYTPGHKQGQGASPQLVEQLGQAVFQMDLPELPGLDNLFAPEMAIAQAQALASEAFGAEHTWFLINGSTAGILAAILATCQPGDKIILPRNAHQSVISGLILSGAVPVFIAPDYDPDFDLVHSLSPAAIQTALNANPDSKAVLVVSPTYHGICGNLAEIAAIVHAHHLPLLVDEAHGPHCHFHPNLPTAALAAGADLTVQSIHKVLSSLTQSAMLHCQGQRLDPQRVSQALRLVQSSSPSYLLLASLDAARYQMATQGKELMAKTLDLANQARRQLSQIPGLTVLGEQHIGKMAGFFELDQTRLTIDVTDLGLTGFAVDEILHQQLGVIAELPTLRHLTFIISLGNTPEHIQQLVSGFQSLCDRLSPSPRLPISPSPRLPIPLSPHLPISPREAFFAPTEMVPIDRAVDRLSADLISPYPPGIPVLMPGEVITSDILDYLQQVIEAGGSIVGISDSSLSTLRVLVDF